MGRPLFKSAEDTVFSKAVAFVGRHIRAMIEREPRSLP